MKSVICTFCNTQIYNYTGPEPNIEIKAENFKPASDYPSPAKGSDLKCPRCFTKWVSWSSQLGQLRMLIDSAYAGSGNIGKNKGADE